MVARASGSKIANNFEEGAKLPRDNRPTVVLYEMC